MIVWKQRDFRFEPYLSILYLSELLHIDLPRLLFLSFSLLILLQVLLARFVFLLKPFQVLQILVSVLALNQSCQTCLNERRWLLCIRALILAVDWGCAPPIAGRLLIVHRRCALSIFQNCPSLVLTLS